MAHRLTPISAPVEFLYPVMLLMCTLLSLTPTPGASCSVINCTVADPVLTGLEVAKSYPVLKNRTATAAVEGLASGVDPVVEDTVCELVAVYDLLEKVASGTYFQSVLRQNIYDGCQWLLYREAVSNCSSESLFPFNCDPQNTTLIQRYCLHKRLEGTDLGRMIQTSTDYLSTERSGPCTSPVDTNEAKIGWIRNSFLIPEDHQDDVMKRLKLTAN